MITRSYTRVSKRVRPHLFYGPRVRSREGRRRLLVPYYWRMLADLDRAKVRGHQRRLAVGYHRPGLQ